MITDREIREYLGHNGAECWVRITRDGEVHRYGSPNYTDRSKDFWHYVGRRDELVAEIGREGRR